MKTKIALLVVLAIAVGVWVLRGAPNPFMNGLGAAAASVDTDYKTEHDWAVREIASDVSEMANNRKVSQAPVVAEGMPWHPETFVSFAAGELGDVGFAEADDPAEQHGALLAMSVDAILKSNTEVSLALKRNMKNPRAHESAALTLAAFALRESAEGLSNTRWALNRMTAHLAMAQALRNGESSSIDGQLAEASLLALTHRQTSSAAILDAIAADTPHVLAWQRALRMRLNQNWKLLDEPAAATRLEKLEYFRARRMAVRGTRAGQDLEDMRVRIAVDFARVAAGRPLSVEDGNDFIDGAIESEVAELKEIYWQLQKRQLSKTIPDDVANERAGRLIAHGDPQVIPWGAWAEFGNRHVGMWAMKIDNHYRHMLGLPDRADQLKHALDAQFGGWTMYSIASTGRTKGQRGTEADLSRINDAIDVAVSAPELVSYDYWIFIENGSNYEPVKRGMPRRATWFAPASADIPYDLPYRAEAAVGALKPAAIEALLDEAPNSMSLLSRVAQRHKTNADLTARVHERLGARVPYDMWAIDSAVNTAANADDRIALRRQACELTVSECLELADELKASDEAAAVAEYERAFANPALDAVAMTWASRWLVNYYERTKQPARATALANRSAAVGSSVGMQTLALLHEQRGQIDDAFRLFSEAAVRYPDCCTPPLAAFLYRQGVVEKNPVYFAQWKVIERQVFSLTGGLQPMATEMKTRPAHGVFVEEDSYWSRQAGLRAGDIIIGVDGFKVDNVEQLDAVLWFKPTAKTYQFTAWRGVLLTAEVPTRHGMTLKTHPLKGWIE